MTTLYRTVITVTRTQYSRPLTDDEDYYVELPEDVSFVPETRDIGALGTFATRDEAERCGAVNLVYLIPPSDGQLGFRVIEVEGGAW